MSSSSSSSFSSGSSSSSSACGSSLYCYGIDCYHFASWDIHGMHAYNTDGCKLYVFAQIINNFQQVSLYKDNLFSDLVADGQRVASWGTGSIALSARNNSGIYGTVAWDGTWIFYSNTITLSCEPHSSSSSTSSLDSSSSSSASSFSTSSSSSQCCANLLCQGVNCAHFSGWTLGGNNKHNTDRCALYVDFDFISSQQQIKLYKRSSKTLADLVAQGQGNAGVISLVSPNSSGLYGTVVWDGTPVYYPSSVIIDCDFSSSSSLSSSSSFTSSSSTIRWNSSSSSSSSLSSSSDSSSSSYSSRTSMSSFSTSSSSSGDSNSSSSESVGNVSTSSSSSFVIWNKTKPLILGMSAINGVGVINRMAQTVSLTGDSYGIGKVYCYFYGPYGTSNVFTMHLDIYTCNDNGEPLNVIASQTMPGSDIQGEGWYTFNVDISGDVPANKYLSFVVWQEGGDEDNYVLWGYYFASTTIGTKALFSNDGVVWQYQEGAIRSLKLIGNFNAYDLIDFRMVTPPAEKDIVTYGLAGGKNYGTKFVNGDYQYSTNRVVIDNPDMISSFVVDASGSMGWNDHFSTRQQFLASFIQKIKQQYPSQALFDIVKFGAQEANVNSITASMGTAASINVDLTTPSRTTFSFVVPPSSATKGDIYSSNGASFTVANDIILETTFNCYGDGSLIPSTQGTLSKVSGSGDLSIDYLSYKKASLADQFIAYGFRNFENNHSYSLCDIVFNGINYEISTDFWEPLTKGVDVPLTLGKNGPKDSDSVDYVAPEDLVLRHPATSANLSSTTKIFADALTGDSEIFIYDTSSYSIGSTVDFIDRDSASLGHTIANVSSLSLTINPPLFVNISSWANNGGIVQESTMLQPVNIRNTTANIQLLDADATSNVTFFLQTTNGTFLEWDILPFKRWYVNNLYWLDQTAILPVSIFDVNDNPFPDGTEIIFYIDTVPSSDEETSVPSQGLTQDAAVGSDKCYLSSTEGFAIGTQVSFVDNTNQNQDASVIEVGTDSGGKYIKFDPILQYTFAVANYARVSIVPTPVDAANASSIVSQSSLLSAGLCIADVTPIVLGRSLDPSLSKPYDLTPTNPSMTYEQVNMDRELVRNNISDIPSIGGHAVLQILPITEDNLKTVSEKNQEASRNLRVQSQDSFTSQLEQNQGDIGQAANSVSDAFGSVTTTTTTAILSMGSDYNITNPIYLVDGVAESSMTTFATQLTEKTVKGLNVPGVDPAVASQALVKSYNIYPLMIVKSENGTPLAKQYLPYFEVDFMPPISVYSSYVGGDISMVIPLPPKDPENCPDIFEGYTTSTTNGVYATGDGFRIDYIVTNRWTLPALGQLTIRIYSNTVVDISQVIAEGNDVSRQDLNVVLPPISTVTDGITVITPQLTDISAWRETVENNPLSQTIETASSNYVGNTGTGLSILSQVQQDLSAAGAQFSEAAKLSTFEYYTNPLQWTKATQYGEFQEFTLPIINGKASLNIPSSDISALLMIQASVYFGDNNKFESIRSDIIPVASPIDIGAISPFKIYAQGGNVLYQIGTPVTWNSLPIADNVIVSFAPQSTVSVPSVSKTDKGWAGGVSLGPHSTIVMTCSDTCPCYGHYEDVVITASHLGYSRTVIRKIEWTGAEPKQADETNEFYFYVDDSGSGQQALADGSTQLVMTADLSDARSEEWIEGQYPSDGRNRQRMMGYQQLPNSLPNLIIVPQLNGINTTLSQSAWQQNVLHINVSGMNRNIGYTPSFDTADPSKDSPPWIQNVTIRTGYHYYDSNQDYSGRVGYGVTQYPVPVVDSFGNPKIVRPYPKVRFIEPLNISISVESYNGEFIRNGVNSPRIVAEVTWNNQPITNKFTLNEGKSNETVIDFPLPNVNFEAGVCIAKNAKPADGDAPPLPIDDRNSVSGCLTIGGHPDVSLDSHSAIVSLSRTDIKQTTDGSHTHECSVDSDGNGSTTSTIILSGVAIADHTHSITNYAALSSGDPAHTHALRSVAITHLNPLINPNVNIAINGYVVYDPTHCSPYQGSTPKPVIFPQGNRMMFSTLYLDSNVKNRDLLLTLTCPTTAYTAKAVTDIDKSINVNVSAKFSSYSVEDYPGHWVIIPEQPVSDGTRFVFNIDCFAPAPPSQTKNVLVMDSGTVRKYMYIRVKATVHAEELEKSIEKIILVNSALSWMPSVYGLVSEPTNDSIYLSSAMNQINTIGASQMNDGVKQAAQRLIRFQTDNLLWKNAKKIIFLLTDGDENSSQYSIQQAIDNVNFVDGKCNVPVIPIRLGYAYGSDDILLNQYVGQTCGSVFYMINSSDQDVIDLMNNVLTSSFLGINDGIYSNTIDLGKDNLASSVSIENILVPVGSKALFRVRFSSDNIKWSSWSEWYDSSFVKDFSIDLSFKGRYFQYQVHLYGNDKFESPELYAGLHLSHYVVQNFSVFFQPIDLDMQSDEYLASIHITHKATVPSTSSVNYGCAQFNSTDIADYSSITRPPITPDRHTILLTRYNEMLLTSNYQKYTAINGGWPEEAQIEVYKVNQANVNGELIEASKYAVNNKKGLITFYNSQSKQDVFAICVYFDPVFRLTCNVVNYGPDPVIIDHIGVLYNITKRIPMTNDGTIIHTPINMRI